MTSKQLAAALIEALTEPDQLPVPVKALIAAAVMSARGAAPTRLGMAKTAGYSYGSSQNHYAELLDALIARIPGEVSKMALADIDPALTTRLREEIQQRDGTIGALRTELAELRMRETELRKYTLALHQRTAELDKQLTAQNGAKISRIRPVD